jgi:hypothetical protein
MTAPLVRYQSFLLRIWQDGPQTIWHASLQCVQTGNTHHFADLDALYVFLNATCQNTVSLQNDLPSEPSASHQKEE